MMYFVSFFQEKKNEKSEKCHNRFEPKISHIKIKLFFILRLQCGFIFTKYLYFQLPSIVEYLPLHILKYDEKETLLVQFKIVGCSTW